MNDNQNPACYKLVGIKAPPHFYELKKQRRGILLTILNEMKKKFGICYTIEISVGRPVIGYNRENNTFSGVINDLNHEKHMFLTPTPVDASEFKVFDSSYLYQIDRVNVVYPYPRIGSDFTGFIKPFTYEMWLSVALLLVGISLLAYFVSKISERSRNQNNEENVTQGANGHAFTAVMTAWKVILAQAIPNPSERPQRILVGVWLIVALFLMLSYKCNLKASLVIPKVHIPFRNMHELVNQNELKWGLPNGAHLAKEAMKAPEGTDLRKLYDRAAKLITDVEQADYLLSTGKYACVVAESIAIGFVIRGYTNNGFCSVTLMEESFFERMMQITFKKGSPLREKFNIVVRRMKEAGIFDYWMKNEFKKGLHCIGNVGKDDKNKLRKLGLGDLGGIFLILLGGFTLAMISFILEVIIGKKQ